MDQSDENYELTVSLAIERLKEILDEHGDMPLCFCTNDDYFKKLFDIDCIKRLNEETGKKEWRAFFYQRRYLQNIRIDILTDDNKVAETFTALDLHLK